MIGRTRQERRTVSSPQIQTVIEQIESAVSQGRPFNLQRFGHRRIVQSLHPIVHSVQREPALLRVIYSDGSESAGFPLFCLPPRHPALRGLEKRLLVRVGLCSGRHLEMDRQIDFYLVRHNEVDQLAEGWAEQERLGFTRAVELLQDSALQGRDCLIELYQTGLETLVLGFYRAVVEVSLDRIERNQPRLSVVPMILAPGRFNINAYLQTVSWQDPKSFRNAVRRLVGTYPDYFRLEMEMNGKTFLEWAAQRPTTERERDVAVENFPQLTHAVEYLYRSSQYRPERPWG